jgi:oxygen-independent coproporphyrinogen-3 oxidase
VRDVYDDAAGFTEINIDRFTAAAAGRASGIEQALALAPTVASLCALPNVRAHQRVIDEHDLPDAATRATLFQQAVTAFVAADYAWIGLDHFARASDPLAAAQREGRLHRNFMGYTTMPASHLVGVGMSSISEVAGCFAQSEPRLAEWRERVGTGRLATIRGHRLSDDDKARQKAILQLMCNLELPYDAVPEGVDDIRGRFTRFADDGLVEFEDDRISVTPLGRFFVRNLCMELDAYLPSQAGQGRFSRTV